MGLADLATGEQRTGRGVWQPARPRKRLGPGGADEQEQARLTGHVECVLADRGIWPASRGALALSCVLEGE